MISDHSSFSAIDTVKQAWEKVKGAKAVFWTVLVVMIFFELVNSGINAYTKNAEPSFFILVLGVVAFVASLIATFISWGLIYIGIQRASDNPIEAGMVKYAFDFWIFLKMIGAGILQFLVLLPAFVLLMLPSIIRATKGPEAFHPVLAAVFYLIGVVLFIFLFVRMFLVPSIVIAEKANPIRAIKESFQGTKSHVFQLIGLFIINWGILIISIIPLGIGLIWTIPYFFINYGVVYKKLTGR